MQNDSNSAAPRAIKVVAMGGGTGLSMLLHGLKQYVTAAGEAPLPGMLPRIDDLSAIVTVSDDGGSSGRLRKELNVPAPGDVRNCIVALSEDEALLSRLFQYRFPAGEGVGGHNFGNLFLSAMTAIAGDFSQAVKHSSEILATRGHIYPATTSNAQLYAIMDDGSVVRGETNITASQRRIVELRMTPANAKPLPVALQANESLRLTASDHIRALYKHARHQFFDYALVNRTPASPALALKYAEKQQAQIETDVDAVEALGVKPIVGEYLLEAMDSTEGLVARHDTHRVAHDLLQLMVELRESPVTTLQRER